MKKHLFSALFLSQFVFSQDLFMERVPCFNLISVDDCRMATVVKGQSLKLEETTGVVRYVGDSNPDNYTYFYTSFEAALNQAQSGDTIILLNDVSTSRQNYKQDSDGRVEAISLKAVTIDGKGYKLHIPVRPLSLQGDVVFKNINLSLQPLSSLDDAFGSLGGGGAVEGTQYIYLNGYRLTFDQVNTKVKGQNDRTRPVIVMGAEKGKIDAGKAEFIVLNADQTHGETKIKGIVAGSLDTEKTSPSRIELGKGTNIIKEVNFGGKKPMTGKVTVINHSTGVLNFNGAGTSNEVILEGVNYSFRTPSFRDIKNLTLNGNSGFTHSSGDFAVPGTLTLSEHSRLEMGAQFSDEILFNVENIVSHNATMELGDSVEFTLNGNITGELNVVTRQRPEELRVGENSNAKTAKTSTGYTISANVIEKNLPLAWAIVSLPEVKVACKDDIPAAENPATTGGKGNVVIRYSDSKPVSYCNATIERTYTATDEDNYSISITQIIKVEDREKPTFVGILPSDMTIEEGQEVPIQAELAATDNCGTARVEKLDSRDIWENGKLKQKIYTWRAIDECGNISEVSQTIIINPKPITPLVWAVTSLPEVKVACKNAIPAAENPATAGGKGNVVIRYFDSQPANYCNATIERTYTATDEDNNSISIKQIIKIEDKERPTFVGTLPSDLVIEEGQEIPAQAELTATDSCGVTSVRKSNQREGNKVIYTWTAADECGNISEISQVIEIRSKKVEAISKTGQPRLYPNPANGDFYLKNIKGITAVRIYDMAGRLIKSFAPQEKYNVEDLIPDIYVVVVKTNDGTENFKLVKR